MPINGARTLARDNKSGVTPGLILPINTNRNWRRGRYLHHYYPSDQPVIYRHASSITALPTAAQGQIDYIRGGAGHNTLYMEMYQSTAQTLMPTWTSAKGLEISLDQADNETVEYVIGGNNAFNPFAMVTGTDSDFFLKVKFYIDDVDAFDQFGIFWRKQEAFAVPVSFLTTGDPLYTDIALFGFAATVANPQVVRASTDINNGGSATVSSTGFTWADGKVHALEIRVIGRVAHYFINGIECGQGQSIAVDGNGGAITAQSTTKPATYTFANALTLVPGIFSRQDAITGASYIQEVSCGHLSQVGLDPNNE